MKIRPYQDKDFLDLERILKETGLYEAEFDKRENYRSQVDCDPESILVATESDKILGGVILLYNPFASFIFHLCVDPEHQNKGIGTELMNEAERKLIERGVKMPIIYVDKGNEQVIDFYKKKQWEICPDAIPMVKKIS